MYNTTISFRLTLKDHTLLFVIHLLELDSNQYFQLCYFEMVINKSGTCLIPRDAGWQLTAQNEC